MITVGLALWGRLWHTATHLWILFVVCIRVLVIVSLPLLRVVVGFLLRWLRLCIGLRRLWLCIGLRRLTLIWLLRAGVGWLLLGPLHVWLLWNSAERMRLRLGPCLVLSMLFLLPSLPCLVLLRSVVGDGILLATCC